MHDRLVDSEMWHSNTLWNEAIDAYWGNIRGSCERNEHMQFYEIVVIERKTFAVSGQTHAIRMQLKSERRLKQPPPHVFSRPPDKIRLKHCKSFKLRNTHSYDMRVTSEGPRSNKHAASLQTPIFEFEIELLRNNAYLSEHSDVHVLGSMFEKALDFLVDRAENPHYTLILQSDSYTAPASALLSTLKQAPDSTTDRKPKAKTKASRKSKPKTKTSSKKAVKRVREPNAKSKPAVAKKTPKRIRVKH
jgi:hypothetical protein